MQMIGSVVSGFIDTKISTKAVITSITDLCSWKCRGDDPDSGRWIPENRKSVNDQRKDGR